VRQRAPVGTIMFTAGTRPQSACSSKVILNPIWRSASAADAPMMPPPMMATSDVADHEASVSWHRRRAEPRLTGACRSRTTCSTDRQLRQELRQLPRHTCALWRRRTNGTWRGAIHLDGPSSLGSARSPAVISSQRRTITSSGAWVTLGKEASRLCETLRIRRSGVQRQHARSDPDGFRGLAGTTVGAALTGRLPAASAPLNARAIRP
jgi:hypothetical protein